MDLDPGCYALVPFSSGCFLKPRRDAHEGGGGSRGSGGRAAEPLALVVGSGEEMKLTNEARYIYRYILYIYIYIHTIVMQELRTLPLLMMAGTYTMYTCIYT